MRNKYVWEVKKRCFGKIIVDKKMFGFWPNILRFLESSWLFLEFGIFCKILTIFSKKFWFFKTLKKWIFSFLKNWKYRKNLALEKIENVEKMKIL